MFSKSIIRLAAAASFFALSCATLNEGPGTPQTGTGTAPLSQGSGAPGPGPIGWASVADFDQNGTTGGGALAPIDVHDAEELADEIDRPDPAVIRIVGSITGIFEVGDNKTIEGAPGATLTGHLAVKGSSNVIVRNLKLVGFNCSDGDECRRGKDVVTISDSAHHIWFDHCDVSDGSDGNFDIVEGSDYVTVSWTKFHYSTRRAGDHQFSNLISKSDDAFDDEGHLKVTFHHVWWADNIQERMPRARFGKIHIFNSLWTTAGNKYCMGPGVAAQYLVENSVFSGVRRPTNLKFGDDSTVVVARGNLVQNTDGPLEEKPGAIFTPPYPYKLDPVEGVQAAVMAGAGPH